MKNLEIYFLIGIQQSIKLKLLTRKNTIKDVAKIFIKLLKKSLCDKSIVLGKTYALKVQLEIY